MNTVSMILENHLFMPFFLIGEGFFILTLRSREKNMLIKDVVIKTPEIIPKDISNLGDSKSMEANIKSISLK